MKWTSSKLAQRSNGGERNVKQLKIHWSIAHRATQIHEMLWEAGFNMQDSIESKKDDDGNVIYYQED
jgi:hypothetical protein